MSHCDIMTAADIAVKATDNLVAVGPEMFQFSSSVVCLFSQPPGACPFASRKSSPLTLLVTTPLVTLASSGIDFCTLPQAYQG